MASEWKRRIIVFVKRFWQPTSACMTCMPGSWMNVMSLAHWTLAFKTGLATGILAVLITFTPARRLFLNRYGNALVVGVLTMIGDAYSHANHYGVPFLEPLMTGLTSGVLALVGWYLFEDRGRRIRAVWKHVAGPRNR